MTRRGIAIVAALWVFAAAWAGCVNLGSGQKSATGSMVGGVAGGLLSDGSLGGLISGMLIGSFVGSAIGDSLDQRDRELAMRAAQQSLERSRSGQASTWRNPDSGASGSFIPVHTYRARDGRYCREFSSTIRIAGRPPEEAYGTACRQPDGSWEIVG